VAAPSITSIDPTQGPLAGGTSVTVNGSGFTDVTGVGFGGTNAPNVQFVSDSQLTATSPQGNTAGDVQVTVVTPAGTSNAATFTYQPAAAAAPSITGIDPTQGPLAGGTSVTVNGSGFTNVTGVGFGGTNAPNVQFVSDSQLTATSPQGNAPGPVDVIVIGPGGQSGAVPFTYTDGGPGAGTVIISRGGMSVTILFPADS